MEIVGQAVAFLTAAVLLVYMAKRWWLGRKKSSAELWPQLEQALKQLPSYGLSMLGPGLASLQCRHKDAAVLSCEKPGKVILMLLGEFSAGKSSFINALLGEDILTTKIRATTAAVTVLSYSDDERAVIHEAGGKIRTIPLTEGKRDIASITAMGKKQENLTELQRIEYVELFLRCEFLRSFDIIDTPGFNSGYEWHTQATKRFLNKADVILWMFQAVKAGTHTEFELLQQAGKQHKLAVVNQIDRIPDDICREDAYRHIRAEIPAKLFDAVFFVSSKKPKPEAPAADYQRIGQIREYLQGEVVHRKAQYLAERQHSFLKETQEAAHRVRKQLATKADKGKKEILALEQEIASVQKELPQLQAAVKNFAELKGKEMSVLVALPELILPKYRPEGLLHRADALKAEHGQLYQEKQNLQLRQERVQNLEQAHCACAEEYAQLKKEYDSSFFSNIADSVWNFVANSNFTEAKDNLDRKEREMQESKHMWQQADASYRADSRRQENAVQAWRQSLHMFIEHEVQPCMGKQEDAMHALCGQLREMEGRLKKVKINVEKYGLVVEAVQKVEALSSDLLVCGAEQPLAAMSATKA